MFCYGTDCPINSFPERRNKILITGILEKAKDSRLPNHAADLFPSDIAFQKKTGTVILHGFSKNYLADRTFRHTSFSRIYQKGIPRRPGAIAVSMQIGVQAALRQVAVIKVKSPLQKTLRILQVQLKTKDAVAAGRHSHKPVADAKTQ